MVRAIARQAEAERERRAKVIHAEGNCRRYPQTPSNFAGDKASTIGFPVPMDLITPMLEALKKRNA